MLIVSGPVDDSGHERKRHPERPERTAAALAAIADLGLGADLDVVAPYTADLDQLSRVHDVAYLEELAAFSRAGGGDLDPDTYATADSWTVACQAAGAGLAAIDALRRAGEGVAFVATRPPGHHALRHRAMGFCLLNNIAVAAAALTAAGERVLIVDWDVHHGNGTQAIFWDDPNVLYVSTHESPLFPGTGSAHEVGGPAALGLTVNVPLPAGATGDVVRRAITEVAQPTIGEFDPTWVLVSAGFDAHRADPLAGLSLSSGDFAELGRAVAAFAPRPGRLALFLEGGYDLEALRTSVRATLSALLGGSDGAEAPTVGGPGTEQVRQARDDRIGALRQAPPGR
ncbi:MAG TPA: histone deacetylase [Acidimicrobiales bacterium]|nr:histone deacetylase [Acidimicrobiales bacterium]